MLLRQTGDASAGMMSTDKKLEQEMKESAQQLSTRSSQKKTEKDAMSGKVMQRIIIFWVITIPIALFFAWSFSKLFML